MPFLSPSQQRQYIDSKEPCTYYIMRKGWGTSFIILCYIGDGVLESLFYNTQILRDLLAETSFFGGILDNLYHMPLYDSAIH